MRQANERFGKNFELLEPALITRFQDHGWPGNVRELKSTIDRVVLLFDGPILRASWWDMPEPRPARAVPATPALPALPPPPAAATPLAATPPAASSPFSAAPPNAKQRLALAKKLLAESDHNYTWVAGQLGINPTTLWRWRKDGKPE